MTAIKTILFDLDGTILDTNELIIRSFLYALEGFVPEDFGREDIVPFMGRPLVEQLRLFSGLEEVDHLVQAYRKVNYALHDELVTAFPHVQEVLARLKEAGVKIGVVTTKIRHTTELGLAHVGIASYMDAIVTIDDVVHPKPHPEPVLQAVELLGADPATTAMVGDSVVDMQSAVRAGVQAIGVAWSLKPAELLRDAGADRIIHDLHELLDLAELEMRTVAQD